jgi:ribosomal protein S27AE
MKYDSFENAKLYAKPECPKCLGTGSFMYDRNHRTVCDRCCTHNMGWWKLEKHYGDNNGKMCCSAGCGRTKDCS